MRKVLYIEYVEKNQLAGVDNKIEAQCSVFAKNYETILAYPQNDDIFIKNITSGEIHHNKDAIKVRKYKSKILNKINHRIKIIKFNLFLKKIIQKEKPQVIYIRQYEILNGITILKKLKKENKIFVIYEIPTYPYEEELIKNGKKLLCMWSKFLDKRMEKVADLIPVVLGKNIELNLDKYIPILNGIDIKNIDVKEKDNVKNYRIDLVGVANISFWHGYDRIIKGLKNYYSLEQKYKVYFNIVGNGYELDNLKKLVKEYNLDDYVIFYGSKKGEELDNIINNSEIGIGSLGMHRSGLTCGSTLKAREYCARGIPFVLGYKDNGFSEEFKYIYNVGPDETPVDINALINFYLNLMNEDYIKYMREYAENNLTWQAVMNPIIDRIESV